MIRILVDSSSDYTLEELKEKQIELVPLTVILGGNSYKSLVELPSDKFYELMTSTGEFPKTSQPSPQDFLNIFEDAKEKGDEVISFSISSALSGTYQSSALAKSMADYEPIYLIDTLTATGMIKMLADYACKLRDEGASAKEIVEKIENLKSKVKVYAAIDTLEYLAKGGRISAATAAIGNLANVKPIITVSEEGTVSILSKCIGRNKAMSTLIKHLKETSLNPDFPIFTVYSYGTENCEKFEEKMKKEGFIPSERLQIGATIGTHVGPGALGVILVEA